MAVNTVMIELRWAWWFMPYIKTLIFFCQITGGYPDTEKLERIVARAAKTRIVGAKNASPAR